MREVPSTTTVPADRRSGAGLRFDVETRHLSLGSEFAVVPLEGANTAVLVAYVDLASRCRGDRMADLAEVRQDDLDALSAALDVDAADLAGQVEQVLGVTRDEAVRFVDRIRQNRLLGGVAKVAAGAALAGSLFAGAGAMAAAARPQPTPGPEATVAPGAAPSSADGATTTTTDMTAAGGWQDDTEPVIDGPLTTTPEGVGLIPPITEEADGTVLVPPTVVDQTPGAS